MDISVRYAERSELEEINRLRAQVNDVHVNGRPDIFRAGFNEALQNHVYDVFDSDDGDVIAAVCGSEICGFATVKYIIKPESPYSLERRFYQIEEFGVDEHHRRIGVATALVDFCKNEARAKGFDRIELDYWAFNEGAEKFYESVGFRVYRKYTEMFV
ncbi:MAG: GNAT family N-acetyltransferase [Ruminococcus sp.]|nr:GNAT family N-acetyltransferase [Ruminococcus sp.]